MADSNREEITRLESLYAGNPGGRVFVHLAEAYRKAGEHERARRILEEGLGRHPDSASGFVVLGRVLADSQEVGDAQTAFRRVLELDGGNLVALRWLGDLARQTGRYEEAADRYRELLARNPSDETIRELLDEVEHPTATAVEGRLTDEPLAAVSAAPGHTDEPVLTEPEYGEVELDDLPGDLASFVGRHHAAPPADYEDEPQEEDALSVDWSELVGAEEIDPSDEFAGEVELSSFELPGAEDETAPLEVSVESVFAGAEPELADIITGANADLVPADDTVYDDRSHLAAAALSSDAITGEDGSAEEVGFTGDVDFAGEPELERAGALDADADFAASAEFAPGTAHTVDADFVTESDLIEESGYAADPGLVVEAEFLPEGGHTGEADVGTEPDFVAEPELLADAEYAAEPELVADAEFVLEDDLEAWTGPTGDAAPAAGFAPEAEFGAADETADAGEYEGPAEQEAYTPGGAAEDAIRDPEGSADAWDEPLQPAEFAQPAFEPDALDMEQPAPADEGPPFAEHPTAAVDWETSAEETAPADEWSPGETAQGTEPSADEWSQPGETDEGTPSPADEWSPGETDEGTQPSADAWSQPAAAEDSPGGGVAGDGPEPGAPAEAPGHAALDEWPESTSPDEPAEVGSAGAEPWAAAGEAWTGMPDAEPIAESAADAEAPDRDESAADAEAPERDEAAAPLADLEVGGFGEAIGGDAVEPSAEEAGLQTETIAELYSSQGFHERAAEVYRNLLRRRPGDERLVAKLRQAEAAARPAPLADAFLEEDESGEVWLRGTGASWGVEGTADATDTPYSWTEQAADEAGSAGPPISELLRELVAWRPGGAGTAPSVSAAPQEVVAPEPELEEPAPGAGGPAADVEWASAAAHAAQAPAAVPDAVEPEPAGPSAQADPAEPAEPAEAAGSVESAERAEPAGRAPSAQVASADAPARSSGDPVEDAFLEWFGGQEAAPGAAPAMSDETAGLPPLEESGGETGDEDEDLEMFRTWLQSLKK